MNHLAVFAEYRAYLLSLAQRILGSALDAEDLLQETFLRWQQTSLAQIRSPKAFLTTVLKRLCLNHLQSAQVRHEELTDSLSPELAFTVEPPVKELVTPALAVLLERLSPKERLVLLLRDVFDYDYEEIAPLLKKSAENCRQILRRARQHLIEGHSRFVVSQTKLQNLAREFARTCAGEDLNSLLAALA
jgi:RNA polymerase sigma-70 factor (ECF subfamily)